MVTLLKKASTTSTGVLDTGMVLDDGSGAQNATITLSNPDKTLVTDDGSGAQNATITPSQPTRSVGW